MVPCPRGTFLGGGYSMVRRHAFHGCSLQVPYHGAMPPWDVFGGEVLGREGSSTRACVPNLGTYLLTTLSRARTCAPLLLCQCEEVHAPTARPFGAHFTFDVLTHAPPLARPCSVGTGLACTIAGRMQGPSDEGLPGPGDCDLDRTFHSQYDSPARPRSVGTGPAFTIAGRTQGPSDEGLPGPGDYDLDRGGRSGGG